MSFIDVVFGSAPGESAGDRLRNAAARAVRTLIQGVAGSFPAAGAGTVVVTATYWEAFGFAVLAAVINALVSFLQNLVGPGTDPTQRAV